MEHLSFNFYSFIIILVILQGFLVAYLFIFQQKFRKKSNLSIAVVLIALGLLGVGNLVQESGLTKLFSFLEYLPIYYELIPPIGLYYSAQYNIYPDYQIQKKDYWLITPLVIIIILNSIKFIAYLINPAIISAHESLFYGYSLFKDVLALSYFLGVIINILQKIKKYHHQLLGNHSNIEGKDLYTIRNIFRCYIPIWFLWAIGESLWHLNIEDDYNTIIIVWVSTLLIIYYLIYLILSGRETFEILDFKESNHSEHKITLSNKTDEHYQKLLKLMLEDKIYRDPLLNMDVLAEKTQLSNGYLSRIINQKEGKNFYDFVNAFRVAEVKSHLNLPNYAHYSILGIALEAGFKSKSTFNAVFKKMTGMTPSAYKKTIQ